jgi:hypothetical protein
MNSASCMQISYFNGWVAGSCLLADTSCQPIQRAIRETSHRQTASHWDWRKRSDAAADIRIKHPQTVSLTGLFSLIRAHVVGNGAEVHEVALVPAAFGCGETRNADRCGATHA